MFHKKTNRTPILVAVTKGRWNSLGDPDSLHHQMLTAYLENNGGIHESVPEGMYHFNIKRHGFRFLSTLEPVK